MTEVTAAFREIPGFDRRVFFIADTQRIAKLGRSVVSAGVTGTAAVAAIAAVGTVATVTAAWLFSTTIDNNPHLRTPPLSGPAALTLAGPHAEIAPTTAVTFDGRWAHVMAAMRFVPVPRQLVARSSHVPLPLSRPVMARVEPAQGLAQGLTQVARLTAAPPHIPLPPRRVAPPVGQAAPQVAMALPAAAVAALPPPATRDKPPVVTAMDGRTAVYDIAAHTVYLPNGERLEAHSGIGEKMDDPRYTKVRMRGPTPPNVYSLTLREELFHGVRAIRLQPLDEDRMHGRDGILAHTYMLGPNGQSNGCVSFRHYDKFLQAFLSGKVDRMVVVASLGRKPVSVAANAPFDRFAANY